MVKLPEFTIEHVNGKWELYNTLTCCVLTFETKLEAETKLKTLL